MVKIRWMITDEIKDISLEKFNEEWNGVFGYFEMCVNNQVLGYFPERDLLHGEEGFEDILYWLSQLLEGIVCLNKGQKYEIQLLSMNLAKLCLKKEDKLQVSFVNSKTNETIWTENVIYNDWTTEVIKSIENFIKDIKKNNSILLKSRLISKLSQI